MFGDVLWAILNLCTTKRKNNPFFGTLNAYSLYNSTPEIKYFYQTPNSKNVGDALAPNPIVGI